MPADFEDEDGFDSFDAQDNVAADPETRAREVVEQLRIHGELAAVYEGPRKFDAAIINLDAEVARELQQTIGKLEKQKDTNTGPILPADGVDAARRVLTMPVAQPRLTTNDYHILRRPNEAMIVRWLAGDEVDSFYERYKAHVEVALEQRREDERQELGWRSDEADQKYLEALDEIEADPAAWYLRDTLQKHGLFLLSTLAVDEMDILHLCDTLMSVPAVDVVGRASVPDPDDESPLESERAWYFKLFSLRGVVEKQERMCFFAFMQRTTDDLW